MQRPIDKGIFDALRGSELDRKAVARKGYTRPGVPEDAGGKVGEDRRRGRNLISETASRAGGCDCVSRRDRVAEGLPRCAASSARS